MNQDTLILIFAGICAIYIVLTLYMVINIVFLEKDYNKLQEKINKDSD